MEQKTKNLITDNAISSLLKKTSVDVINSTVDYNLQIININLQSNQYKKPKDFSLYTCTLGDKEFKHSGFIISRNYLTTNDDILSSFMNIRHVKRLEEKEFIIRSIETGTGPEDYVSGFFLIQNGRLKPLF